MAQIQQPPTGATITVVLPSLGNSTSSYTAYNVLNATSLGSIATVDTTSMDGGRIQWVGGTLDGQTWVRIALGGQWANPAGDLVSIVQSGNSLTFVDKVGNQFPGSFVDAATVNAPSWGGPTGLTGTLTNEGTINWSNGKSWRKLNLSPDYVNAAGNDVHVISNGSTSLMFVDKIGNRFAGNWSNSTQVIVPAWGNLVGTIANGQIQWANGNIWNKNLQIGGTSSVGPGTIGIRATNVGLTLVNRAGGTTTAQITSANTIQAVAWGLLGTRQRGRIVWNNNRSWDNFDFNALDAVFADLQNFPFG